MWQALEGSLEKSYNTFVSKGNTPKVETKTSEMLLKSVFKSIQKQLELDNTIQELSIESETSQNIAVIIWSYSKITNSNPMENLERYKLGIPKKSFSNVKNTLVKLIENF